MLTVESLKNDVLNQKDIQKEEAMWLYDADLKELCAAADGIRIHFCSDIFDMCTIINGKSGRCSEDCKYCAQSVSYQADIKCYPLLHTDEILDQAKYNDERKVPRYSIVTSGRALSDTEIDRLCESIRLVKEQTGITVCVSLGLLDKTQYKRLKDAGVSRVHNNLETSRRNFPNICTTHSYDDKINSIKAAQSAGLSVCSGGIMGLGETKEDRIDMAFTLKELGIKSVPVNMLNPIAGTPFAGNALLTGDDMKRIVAVYRFLLPDAAIRLAGGRGLLADKGQSCFASGANAAISGDMLTTSGISIEMDMQMVRQLGYKVVSADE